CRPNGEGLHKHIRGSDEQLSHQDPASRLLSSLGRIHTHRKIRLHLWATGAKTVVVDTGTYEVTETIKLQSTPSYITPDPNGKYVYASVKAGLQVIDTSSLQIVNTVPTGGVIGTPLVLK